MGGWMIGSFSPRRNVDSLLWNCTPIVRRKTPPECLVSAGDLSSFTSKIHVSRLMRLPQSISKNQVVEFYQLAVGIPAASTLTAIPPVSDRTRLGPSRSAMDKEWGHGGSRHFNRQVPALPTAFRFQG
jgi:hypothetical protein